MPFFILLRGKPDGSCVALHGTLIGPVVAAVVGFAILLSVVADVEEFAQQALALEEIGAVIVFYSIMMVGPHVWSEDFQGVAVLLQGFVDASDSDSVPDLVSIFLMGIYMIP